MTMENLMKLVGDKKPNEDKRTADSIGKDLLFMICENSKLSGHGNFQHDIFMIAQEVFKNPQFKLMIKDMSHELIRLFPVEESGEK